MLNILCYGDSNTFGLSPEWVSTGKLRRHAPNVRWTGRLQEILGDQWRIIEEGLNGRTTVFEDPFFPGRSGIAHLSTCLESHQPLDAVIFMLGTNDTKDQYCASSQDIAAGLSRLIKTALDPFLYLFGSVPKILVAVPVPLGLDAMALADGITTDAAIKKSEALAVSYAQTAKMYGCEYINLGDYASAAPGEGVHLNSEAHAAVAQAFAGKLRSMFSM